MNLQDRMFRLIEDWQTSGQKKSAFLKDKGVSLPKFSYWLKKYNSVYKHKGGFGDFISVGLPPDPYSRTPVKVLELTTASGITIKVFG